MLLPALMARASAACAAEPAPAPVFEPAPVPEPVRALIYQDDSKSTLGAFALELAFPGLGSIYAEDGSGALITLGLVAAGPAAIIVGISLFPIYDGDGPGLGAMPQKTNPAAVPLVIGGLAVGVYGRIYGLRNAVNAADRYNTALRTSLGLAPFVTSDASGITLGGRF